MAEEAEVVASGIQAVHYSFLIQRSPATAAHQETGEAEETAEASGALVEEVLVVEELAEIID